MSNDLALPDRAADETAFRDAIRALRDHLLGAVEVDAEITLNGRAYAIVWADRRGAETDEAMYSVVPGARVIEPTETRPAEIVPTGEEQITVLIDRERLIFHLMQVRDLVDEPSDTAALASWRRRLLGRHG